MVTATLVLPDFPRHDATIRNAPMTEILNLAAPSLASFYGASMRQ
jgi:hypothetical protein